MVLDRTYHVCHTRSFLADFTNLELDCSLTPHLIRQFRGGLRSQSVTMDSINPMDKPRDTCGSIAAALSAIAGFLCYEFVKEAREIEQIAEISWNSLSGNMESVGVTGYGDNCIDYCNNVI